MLHDSLSSQPSAVNVLCEMIVDANETGRFCPNDSFKANTAEKLGTSYPVIANCITKLKSLGVITQGEQRGVYTISMYDKLKCDLPDDGKKYSLSIEIKN